jgi:tetratricopeptide (TPR) repeat protein
MREVYGRHGTDLDVITIFAEALMNRTPWLLWDLPSGQPAEGASTGEAQAVLETAFASVAGAWDHPGLLHMYIHLMEMSPTPEAALKHGDRLTDLVPDSGHLIHMATHIDVLCGDYQNVVARNRKAAEIDRKYEDAKGAKNFYTVYRIHNVHFEAYGAMFLGQPEVALAASDRLIEMLPRDVTAFLPELFESFHGKKVHVMVRFGMWQEIVDMALPDEPDLYRYTTCAIHQAKAVALANLGRHDEAAASRDLAVAARGQLPDDWMVFNNTAFDVLAVGEAMMEGETRLQGGADRRGARPPAPVGRDRRRASLRRAMGLDAARAPRAWCAPDGGRAARGGGSGLSRRSGPRRDAGARLPASGQRLEPARAARMPRPARRDR